MVSLSGGGEKTYQCYFHSLLNARHCARLWRSNEEHALLRVLGSQSPPSQTTTLRITFRLDCEQESCVYSLELSQPGVGNESAENGCQVAQSNECVVDGSRQIVVPFKELCEVQNQECCPQRAGGGREETQLGVSAYVLLFTQGGGVSKIVTSHSIVGKSFAELIDHDEKDAQGITKATLTKRNSQGLKYATHWSIFTNER